MIRKILIIVFLTFFSCKLIYAQNIMMDDFSFDDSLETLDSKFVKRGFVLVDNDGNSMYYKGTCLDVDLSIFVRYTPYSRKVYCISVRFDRSHYLTIKKYFEQKINIKTVERSSKHHVNHLFPMYRYIYDVSDKVWIGIDTDKIDITHNEYGDLYQAETCYPQILKKRNLRHWQRKYKNKLFYDENPAIKHEKR